MGRNHDDVAAESDAMRLLAAAYTQQGDHPSAVILLQSCVSLVKIPVERAKLHLEIASILKKNEQDPREQLELAVDAAECSSDSQVKAQVCSSDLRHYKEVGERRLAEELLQRQKDLLHYDLGRLRGKDNSLFRRNDSVYHLRGLGPDGRRGK